ncbi:hypothetical protein, partial [Aliiroseovarius sp. 2305UL8-7]|uniref:hypothetical protein n=1 Tax=Aliiroseovarius conchicola TaxID=3121637 RepID=UPI003528E98D
GGVFRCSRLLRHLDLLIDKMNQKSSSIQILKSVQRVLTSDTVHVTFAASPSLQEGDEVGG